MNKIDWFHLGILIATTWWGFYWGMRHERQRINRLLGKQALK